jgi:hypothetical protein
VPSNQDPITKTDDNFTTASVTLEPQDVSNQNPCYPCIRKKIAVSVYTNVFATSKQGDD